MTSLRILTAHQIFKMETRRARAGKFRVVAVCKTLLMMLYAAATSSFEAETAATTLANKRSCAEYRNAVRKKV